jgi:predicted acyl esterase
MSFDNKTGHAYFDYKIPNDLILAGPMKLQVYIEVENCSDVNIFVGVFKLKDNINIPFEGSYGFGLDSVAKGCLKASLRRTELSENSFYEPNPTFDRIELLKPKQVVAMEIVLLPSSTLWRKDEVLRLKIQGHALFHESKLYSQLNKYESSPAGETRIHCGKKYNSYLLVPHLNDTR